MTNSVPQALHPVKNRREKPDGSFLELWSRIGAGFERGDQKRTIISATFFMVFPERLRNIRLVCGPALCLVGGLVVWVLPSFFGDQGTF